MYYASTPTPSFNQKDLENQEKTRRGFTFDENDTHAVEDPKITVAANEKADDSAIIKEPSK